MDPAQGETGGGKSLSSKLKSKVPHSRVKDRVIGLKNRLPGMKKHSGEEDAHEDSSEYDETSPRGPVPETGDHVAFSSSPKSSPRAVHFPDEDYRPAQTGYDSQNRNYVATAPSSRPAPVVNDSPRSHMAPALEEKFQHLGVGQNPTSPRSHMAPALEENFQHLGVGQNPTSSRSHMAPALEEKIQHLGVGQNPTSPYVDAGPAPTDRGVQPEQQFSSPSTAESVAQSAQNKYSDVPRKSFRSNTMPATNKGMLEKVKDTVVGATGALGDKMGYYNDHNPADPNAPSLLSKAKSTLGVDKPRDPNAPPLTQRAKTYINVASSTAADHAAWTKDRVAAQTTPTHHDKALSEQVTQSLSSLPGAIKEKVFGPASPSSRSPNSPGIVDRVSGAVSSLFTTAPKDQDTFPAHSHHDASAAAGASGFSSAPTDRSSVPERVAATSTPDYSTVNN